MAVYGGEEGGYVMVFRNGSRGAAFGALILMVFIGLVAAATPAGAQVTACTRDGNQLSWTPTDATVQVRGYVDDTRSRWLGAVSGAENSYELTAVDLDKAPADSFFIRFRVAGEVTDVQCTDAVGPVGPSFCIQNGTVLTWGDVDGPVSRSVFHVRRVNNDGTTSWVGRVDDANPHTFNVASATDSYVIRYRVTTAPGNTTVIDETCTPFTDDGPVASECSVALLGIVQSNGYFVIIEDAVPGVTYTLFVNGEAIETASAPLNLEGITDTENVYFELAHNGISPLIVVDIAPADDVGAIVSCGTLGVDSSPVTSCTARDGGSGTVELYLSPSELLPWEVAVDGVITEAFPEFEFLPFPVPPSYYVVDGLLTSSFTIVQDSGNVDCTGDEANFCTSFGTRLVWISAGDVERNNEYNVRRINADGSSTWVWTTNGVTAVTASFIAQQTGKPEIDFNDGEFLIRYRVLNDAGNEQIIDHVCVPLE